MALAVILALGGGLSLLLGEPKPTGTAPSGAPTPSAEAPTLEADVFPSEVVGMPVVSVSEAQALIAGGGAEGRVLAVGGWWLTGLAMSCPWPGRDPLPIEGYCYIDYLSSAYYERWACTNFANGSECHGNPVPPGVDIFEFVTMEDTGGRESLRLPNDPRFRSGGPVVFILHVADLRAQQCPASAIPECAQRAVVDRVAWVAGVQVGVGSNQQSVTTMTAEEAAAAAGIDGELLGAAAVQLGDAWKLDPRLQGVGDAPVWVLRAITDEAPSPEDPSRGVDIALVDDASGQVLQRIGPESVADHEQARLVVQTTWPEPGSGFDSSLRVETIDGRGLLAAAMGHSIQVENGPSHNVAIPILLGPGTYVVRVWRGIVAANDFGQAPNQCSTEVTLDAASRLTIEAALSRRDECAFVSPTFTSSFDQ